MPAQMRIIFDNPYATFYAGQTVTGHVFLSLDKPKKVRAVTIDFKGEAQVSWTESETKRDSAGKDYEETTSYHANETYFENKYYLLGSANGEVEINAGDYTYPFTCQIPPTVPSSFEGEHGHIRYTVKSVLDRPWKFDSECKAAFTVVAPLDLNTLPQVKEPIQFEKSKHFCCLWCKSGPLTLTVKLPVSGYVPGQVIPFQIEIENASNIRVRPINCVLRKEVRWHAKTPFSKTKETRTTLADLAVDEVVNAHDSKSFSKDITVPAVPPSNLANCGIIDLEYVLKVEAVVGGCHKNASARIPITLGTIPLLSGPTAYKPAGTAVGGHETLNLSAIGEPSVAGTAVGGPGHETLNLSVIGESSVAGTAVGGPGHETLNLSAIGKPSVAGGWSIHPPAASGSPTEPPNPSVTPSAPPLYPQLPPPSYEESIFQGNTIKDSTDNEHTMGIQNFTPRYPVWNFGPSAPPT